ncbi:DHH family phosphoesterase [Corynebacterium lubricantis]|uniref:DHH family phosphoesterase n=1 Tax=Corynebacterium lubricantis TaxID=541095 RepID=UPI0003637854|nr:DHH family phosphoesterase [Corynebacterium lubricantis]
MARSEMVDAAGAAALLTNADSVAVITHVQPDADAIGSASALSQALKQMGKTVYTLIGQPFDYPENLNCIPGSEDVALTDQLPATDLVVTVDCASRDRTGMLEPAIALVAEKVLVIDHHKSNPAYGAYNIIQTAESTTTVLRGIFEHLDVEMDYNLAFALYSGLVTDTGSFRWGTERMHTLAAELMSYGLNTRQIAMDLMDELTSEDIRLIGEVMSGVQIVERHGIKVAVLTAGHDHYSKMTQSAVEMLIDYVRVLRGTDIGVVFKEIDYGWWSVSLRSATVDVSKIAGRLGGGGHAPAAGYSSSGTPQEVVDKLLGALIAQ